MEINFFDLVIFSILALSSFVGLYKGFIKSVVALLSTFLLICLSYLFTGYVKLLANIYIKKAILANVVSGLGAFLIALVVVSIVNAKFLDFIKDIRGGTLDRLCGVMFGVFRGACIAIIIFGLLIFVTMDNITRYQNVGELSKELDQDKFPEWLKSGVSYQLLYYSSKNIISIMPEDFVNNYIMNIKLFQVDKAKDVSESLKRKADFQLKGNDEDEYFGIFNKD